MIEFPKDFFWGAATAAYQVEGNNLNADWWEWEKRTGVKESSGKACRHYEFYKQDFDLAKSLNHNCHRFSIEWSRVEPQENKFDESEINHYQDVVLSLKERNLEPIVTLHHFTNPIWFARAGGWGSSRNIDYFLKYVEKIVGALGDRVRFWVTINEPLVYTYHSYILGVWPPQEKSLPKSKVVTDNLACAHIKAYKLIHAVYKKRNLPAPSISIAKNLQAFAPCKDSLRNRIAVYLRDRGYNFAFLDELARHKALDFIGINYYTRGLVDTEGWRLKNLLLDTCKKGHSQLEKNTLGWDIYPEGLYKLLVRIKRYNLPVFILENGICTENDNARRDFIRQHLKSLHSAMDKGVKVLGYIYWSLIDNYEWDKGFAPRFGIIGVDYNTYERTIRESAKEFAQTCKTGRLE